MKNARKKYISDAGKEERRKRGPVWGVLDLEIL